MDHKRGKKKRETEGGKNKILEGRPPPIHVRGGCQVESRMINKLRRRTLNSERKERGQTSRGSMNLLITRKGMWGTLMGIQPSGKTQATGAKGKTYGLGEEDH